MKVAIIIAGHLRCWKQMYPYFKANFIDRYNPDIFISTWNDEGWWKWGNEKGIYENSALVNFDEVRAAFNPKDLKHDNYDEYDGFFSSWAEKFTNRIGWPKNVLSMTYRWQDGCKILNHYVRTNNIQYDLVIRTRTDLEILGTLPDLDPSNFHIIYNHYQQGGLNDVIHIGNMNDIFKVNTMYYHMDELYDKVGFFCPHNFAQEIVKSNNINLTVHDIPYRIMNTPFGQHQDIDKHIR